MPVARKQSYRAARPAAFRLIGRQLERALHAQDRIRRSGDPDAVHDFRVSQRRTRVLLRECAPLLPGRARRLRSDLRWLARRTGPVRDLDMLIARIRDTAVRASAARRPRLEAQVVALETERSDALRRLLGRLDSDRYRSVLHRWRSLSLPPAEPVSDEVKARFAAWLRPRLAARYARLTEAGARLAEEADDAGIHRARIAAKSVRYLLEFLEDAAADDDIPVVIERLRQLQDRLGAFQDLVVHVEMLSGRADADAGAGEMPAPGSARALALRLAARRDRARGAVVREIGRFCGESVRKRVERIVEFPPVPGGNR